MVDLYGPDLYWPGDERAEELFTPQAFGSAMVAAGWAVDYPHYAHGRYAADEAGARGRRDGVWQGDFVRPDVWRHSGSGRRGRP